MGAACGSHIRYIIHNFHRQKNKQTKNNNTTEQQLFIAFISNTWTRLKYLTRRLKREHKALSETETDGLQPTAAPREQPWLAFSSIAPPPASLDQSAKRSPSLTSEEAAQDLSEHRFVDLRVGDGVQQLPLLLAGEDELAQLLPVDLPVLQEDL